MSSTNKTAYYELSQYIGTDKPTYLGDYNADMLAIDTGIHAAAADASTALSTANSAASTASDAATAASGAVSTANSASTMATQAQTTAEAASTNASAALTAAQGAQTAASANTIANLAPAYDSTLTYAVGDRVTYIDALGSGKLYQCIVAVTTPEAFNINKWDDVTVSEVIAQAETGAVQLNAVTNLAPAYDHTATYSKGDLCTYITGGEGKLYQANQDISTAEAFNSGHWDAVTTNDAYYKNYNAFTLIADGVKSYKDIFNDLYAYLNNNIIDAFIVTESTSAKNIFKLDAIQADAYKFGKIQLAASDASLSQITITGGSSTSFRTITFTTAPAITYTNSVDDVVTAGNKITLYY